MTRSLPRAVFGLLLLGSLYLFLAPVPDAGPPGSDKVGHVLVFAVLALAGRLADVRPAALALALTAYAGVTEVLQALLPLGRHGDPADFAADVVGVAVGIALWAAVARARLSTGRRAARDPSPPPG